MSYNKEFSNVQIDVDFTKASEISELVSRENIAVSFGKLAKWHDKLAVSDLDFKVDGVQKSTYSPSGSNNAFLDFVSGNNISLSYSSNAITIAHTGNQTPI